MPAGLEPIVASYRSLPTQDHVEPFLNRMNIEVSLVFSRISCGNASSMRRLPECGLTAVQMARRACSNSGRQCQ